MPSERRAPCLLPHVMSAWPALSDWRVITDVLTSSTTVRPSCAVNDDNVFYGDMGRTKKQEMSLSAMLEHTEGLYLSQHSLLGNEAALQAISPFPVPREELCAVNLWYSSVHTTSMLHHDGMDNYLCVISGSKEVHLYAPSEAIPAAGSAFGKRFHHCLLSAAEYCARVSRGALCPRVVHLAAGECLFIPQGWWHYVTSEPRTLAVNFWLPPCTLRQDHVTMQYHAATHLRNMLASQVWQHAAVDNKLQAELQATGWDVGQGKVEVIRAAKLHLPQLCQAIPLLDAETVFALLHLCWKKIEQQYCSACLDRCEEYIEARLRDEQPELFHC